MVNMGHGKRNGISVWSALAMGSLTGTTWYRWGQQGRFAIRRGQQMAIETGTTLESYFEFHDDGALWISGHRVGIDLLLEAYKDGVSPEQIAEQFDTIRLEDVYPAITYYLRNKDWLDAWLAEIEASFNRAVEAGERHPTPISERLRVLWELWRPPA